MSDKNKGGRPKSYTDAQVDQAIAQAESQGLPVGAETVKTMLCNDYGISSGINSQSLERAIAERVEVLEARRARDLLEKLPTEAMDAASELSEQFRQSLVGFLARSFDVLRVKAGEREAAKEEDLRNARARIRDLEADVAARADAISDLETTAEKLRAELDEETREVDELRAQLERHSRDALQADLMMEMVKQAVAGAMQDANGSESRNRKDSDRAKNNPANDIAAPAPEIRSASMRD